MTGAPAPSGVLPPGIRRVGVVSRDRSDELPRLLARLEWFAEANGLELFPEASLGKEWLPGRPPVDDRFERLDLLLTIGGDGTLLRGVRLAAPFGVPVLGVNLGRLGFLTSLAADDMEKGLARVLAGEARLDSRFTVEARVLRGDGRPPTSLWALNDLVIHKAGVARVVRLDLSIGEEGARQAVGSFSGDGLIVSTPTGSTAYSLSSGGPVVEPSVECLIATPISPHTMAMRPLVLPADVHLAIRAHDRDNGMVLTADGRVQVPIAADDEVVVGKGTVRATLVRFPDQTFFDTLRRKLNWAL